MSHPAGMFHDMPMLASGVTQILASVALVAMAAGIVDPDPERMALLVALSTGIGGAERLQRRNAKNGEGP